MVGRYLDKLEEERQAALKVAEEKAALKRAELETKKKTDDEAKKAAAGDQKKEETDAEMKDVLVEEGGKVDEVGGGEEGKK